MRPSGAGQRGDEQAVVAPRRHAGDGARGVAAEAVGDQPLARQQRAPGRAPRRPARACAAAATRARASGAVVRCASASSSRASGAWRSRLRARRRTRARRRPAPGRRQPLVASRPAACRSRRSAASSLDHAHRPARIRRAAPAAARAPGRRCEVAAEVHEQQPVVARSSGASKKRSTNASGAEHRAVHAAAAPARGTPGPRGAAAAGRGAARTTCACRSRSREVELAPLERRRRRRVGQPRLRRPASARLGNCAQELAPARRAPASASSRLVVGEVEERRATRRTPGPGTASACRATAAAARSCAR